MRILVAIRNKGYYRFVKPILDELAPDAEIVLLSPDVDELFSSGDNCPYVIHEPIKNVRWVNAFLRYRKPVESVGWITALLRQRFRGASAYYYWALLGILKQPALDRFGQWVVKSNFLRKCLSRSAILVTWLGYNQKMATWLLDVFRRLENATVDRVILDQVKSIAPDLILTIPGIYPQTWDIDYIKAGRALSIPTVIQVASWDHLSGKGWLSVIPDNLFVWNRDQAKQAHVYHAVPAESVIAIGSPSFDWLFEGHYQQSRVAFCQQTRLDPARSFILWAESAPGNCLDEPRVVKRLIEEMRKYPVLSDCQVLIRPHPSPNATDWGGWQISDSPVWESPGFPTGDEAKSGLYNSLVHATAVVGLSTSVFLEAGILDRPVGLLRTLDTIGDSVFNKSIHFEKLLQNNFPVARQNEADCARWLAEIAAGHDEGKISRRQFVTRFLRPQESDQPSAKVAANAILNMAGQEFKRV